MNDKKICFILCVNNDMYLDECVYYINKLEIPTEYEIDIITVRDADSMTSGYNAAMQTSDAKYKIYIHQDVFLIKKDMIYDILRIFEDNNIGMIGMIGTQKIPDDGCNRKMPDWSGCALPYGHRCVPAKRSAGIVDGYFPKPVPALLRKVPQNNRSSNSSFLLSIHLLYNKSMPFSTKYQEKTKA